MSQKVWLISINSLHSQNYSLNLQRKLGTCLGGGGGGGGGANNKSADQPAHHAVWSASLLFAFRKVLNVNLLQMTFNFLASLCSRGDWFETRFGGNQNDRFSRDEAQLQVDMYILNLRIHTVWSESQFYAKRNVLVISTHTATIKDSDHTARMVRLIWAFNGWICQLVPFYGHWCI